MLTVKTVTGSPRTISVHLGTDTVDDLKVQIEGLMNVPRSHQLLVLKGTVLAASASLSKYPFRTRSTVYLFDRKDMLKTRRFFFRESGFNRDEALAYLDPSNDPPAPEPLPEVTSLGPKSMAKIKSQRFRNALKELLTKDFPENEVMFLLKRFETLLE